MNPQPEPWKYDGRRYFSSVFTHISEAGNGFRRELEDVGPTPGRGVVLEVFRDDTTGVATFMAFTDLPLPFALVHRFVAEAARDLTPEA